MSGSIDLPISSGPPTGAAGGELSGTYPNPTLVNSAVIGKVLTGFVSGSGTVTASDSILTALQKLSGSSGGGFTVQAVSSNISLANGKIYLVDTSTARTLTCPSPAANTQFIVKDSTFTATTNNITIAPFAAEKIEGNVVVPHLLQSNGGSWFFVSDGTDWFII